MSHILILQDLDLCSPNGWMTWKTAKEIQSCWALGTCGGRPSSVSERSPSRRPMGDFFKLFFWASCWCYIGNHLCGFFGMLCVFCFSELHMEIQHHPSTMDRWDFLRLHPIHNSTWRIIQSPVINGFLYQDPGESNFPVESGDTIPAEPVGMATETPSISKIERHRILSMKSLWIYFTN